MNVTVTNLGLNPLSTDVGLVLPGSPKTVSMGPLQAYRAAEGLKTLVDAGKCTVTITEETRLLDTMELGPQTPPLEALATVTTAQVLALNATPVSILAAPGAGKMLILDSLLIHKPAGTAYAGIAAGEDLAVKYTDASGLALCNIEATGFLDQATAQTRFARPFGALATPTDSSITPVENAALVLHMLVGEVITGTSDLKLKLFYRILPSTL